jgi:hypothetical protein
MGCIALCVTAKQWIETFQPNDRGAAHRVSLLLRVVVVMYL